ncbi:MAG: carbohydrate ABC transporter permease [Anaerolineae bacterium]|nr:carbohydrate ABC transporter permease [Anaerolineae bacterium]
MTAQRGLSLTLLLRYTILILVCVVMMAPVATAFLGSIRTTGEFLSSPFGLPQSGIRWENYTNILNGTGFWRSLVNSLLITAGVTFLNITCASMLALVFSRIRFTGRNLLFNLLSLGLLVPVVVAILPIFIQLRRLGLIGNLLGVVLPLAAFGLPGSTVILRGFFMNIPSELEDAAYIDGCTTLGFFYHILLPLSRPALMAVAVIQVINSWNDYFVSLLVLLPDPNQWPLPLGIQQFQGQYGTDWAPIMAYVTLLIIPAIVFYMFTEKYIVTGLTGGELKG